MRIPLFLMLGTLLTVSLSGCFNSEDDWVASPGEGFKETGRTIRITMTVLDIVDEKIYPTYDTDQNPAEPFGANLWAFCAKPTDPDDTISAAAIEYFEPLGGDLDGTLSNEAAWGGKCSVPGPTLRVQQGDRVIVTFANEHVHRHTIHWHGQHVPWESDGVPGSTQDAVPSGGTFVYDFIAKRAGTLWYHCHVDTQFHVMQGLYGMMIVEPQDDHLEPDVDREQVLIFSTMRRELVEATPARIANPHIDHQSIGSCGETGTPGCQNPSVDITPDVFMINGRSAPYTFLTNDTLIHLKPGEKVRLRLLNAGSTVETFHTHGHDMLVTHIDGHPLQESARYWVDTITIGPAQRYDVVLEGKESQAGIWVAHTHVTNHVTNDGQYPGGMLTKIVYPGFEDELTPYKHELTGGQPYSDPLQPPTDFITSMKRNLGTGIGALPDNPVVGPVAETFTFPVEMACAVRQVTVSVGAEASNAGFQGANDLTVTIYRPDGSKNDTLTMGSDAYAEWRLKPTDDDRRFFGTNPEKFLVKNGNYTVELSGTAVDTSATVGVFVDYFDDLDQLRAHRACGQNQFTPYGG